MNRLIVVTAACVLIGAPVAHSQAPTSQAPTEAPIAPTTTVNLSLEQQHTIKEVVKDAHLPPVTVNFPMSVGESVPASVALQPMPSLVAEKVPQVKSHRLFVTGNRIVLVNPNDRRIAGLIDDQGTTGQSPRP